MADRTKCESCGMVLARLLDAERLAAAVNIMIRRGVLDARSLAGDELLNYYQGDESAPDVPCEDASWQVLFGDRDGEEGHQEE